MRLLDHLSADLFKSKTAFVTGGGSGINFGIVRALVSLGCRVTICGRNEDRLNAAIADLAHLDGELCAAPADVRNYAQVESALARSEAAFGPADLLVCGAAGNFLSAAEDLSSNGFKSVVDIDLVGSFHCARAAFDQLSRTRGNIVFVSAGQALMPFANQVHAGAAKAGIDNMMRNLALEWGKFGIRSNCVTPGYVGDTLGAERIGSDSLAGIAAVTPLGRLAHVDEIAHAVIFLASPLAAFVTGATLVVDGGGYLAGSGVLQR